MATSDAYIDWLAGHLHARGATSEVTALALASLGNALETRMPPGITAPRPLKTYLVDTYGRRAGLRVVGTQAAGFRVFVRAAPGARASATPSSPASPARQSLRSAVVPAATSASQTAAERVREVLVAALPVGVARDANGVLGIIGQDRDLVDRLLTEARVDKLAHALSPRMLAAAGVRTIMTGVGRDWIRDRDTATAATSVADAITVPAHAHAHAHAPAPAPAHAHAPAPAHAHAHAPAPAPAPAPSSLDDAPPEYLYAPRAVALMAMLSQAAAPHAQAPRAYPGPDEWGCGPLSLGVADAQVPPAYAHPDEWGRSRFSLGVADAQAAHAHEPSTHVRALSPPPIGGITATALPRRVPGAVATAPTSFASAVAALANDSLVVLMCDMVAIMLSADDATTARPFSFALGSHHELAASLLAESTDLRVVVFDAPATVAATQLALGNVRALYDLQIGARFVSSQCLSFAGPNVELSPPIDVDAMLSMWQTMCATLSARPGAMSVWSAWSRHASTTQPRGEWPDTPAIDRGLHTDFVMSHERNAITRRVALVVGDAVDVVDGLAAVRATGFLTAARVVGSAAQGSNADLDPYAHAVLTRLLPEPAKVAVIAQTAALLRATMSTAAPCAAPPVLSEILLHRGGSVWLRFVGCAADMELQETGCPVDATLIAQVLGRLGDWQAERDFESQVRALTDDATADSDAPSDVARATARSGQPEVRYPRFTRDQRAGVSGELHIVSTADDVHGDGAALVTVRIGRDMRDSALGRLFDDFLHPGMHGTVPSMLFIGPPRAGTTTLLRVVTAQLAAQYGSGVLVVDTNNELGGAGRVAHRAMGHARRVPVPSRDQLARKLREAVLNHSPDVLVVDDIQDADEVSALIAIADRGIPVFACVHGSSLASVLRKPTLAALIGQPELVGACPRPQRTREPVFQVAVECATNKRVYRVHDHVVASVDALLERTGAVLALSQLDCAHTRWLGSKGELLYRPATTERDLSNV